MGKPFSELMKDPSEYAKLRKRNMELTLKDMREYEISDQLIIQTVAMIDEMGRVANRLSGRLRDWLAWIVPEARREVTDSRKLAELVSSMSPESLVQDIRKRNPDLPDHFGAKPSGQDWSTIQSSAESILSLYARMDELESTLDGMMDRKAANIKALAGTMIGAKLISHAGSLKRLSAMPASTVQLLGAEKALFRHLRTGARCPKHGIIINHPLLAQADRSKRGKIARMLADKISLASRVDYFRGEFVGDRMRKELEAKVR